MKPHERSVRDEEEDVLIARVARRDTQALEWLYLRFRPRLHRFLLALGCERFELDELCNETFFVVWRKAGSYDRTCRPSTWIFAIARNKALDLLRRRLRNARQRVEAEIDEVRDMRLNDTERLELGDRIADALDGLPTEQRAVVELAFFEGLAYQDIARLLGCPEATVKTRMFHARRKLRKFFPDFAGEAERRHSR